MVPPDEVIPPLVFLRCEVVQKLNVGIGSILDVHVQLLKGLLVQSIRRYLILGDAEGLGGAQENWFMSNRLTVLLIDKPTDGEIVDLSYCPHIGSDLRIGI